MAKNVPLPQIILFLFLLSTIVSCKKDNETPAATPKAQLTGNGTVKYWQAVSISEVKPNSAANLYLNLLPCAVDNYYVFFDNGDYEERGFGLNCNVDERLIVNSYKWELNGNSFKVKGINGSSIYETTSTLFGSEVTITELTSTRFKGFRLQAPGDTIKFTLSAVPM